MSERQRNSWGMRLPGGWLELQFLTPTLTSRLTVTVRWNAPGKREFQRTVERLGIDYRESQRFGDDGATGNPRAIAFTVWGVNSALDALTRCRCVENVEYADRAVFSAGGAGEEKPRAKNTSYTPSIPIVPMAK